MAHAKTIHFYVLKGNMIYSMPDFKGFLGFGDRNRRKSKL